MALFSKRTIQGEEYYDEEGEELPASGVFWFATSCVVCVRACGVLARVVCLAKSVCCPCGTLVFSGGKFVVFSRAACFYGGRICKIAPLLRIASGRDPQEKENEKEKEKEKKEGEG